MKFSIVIPTFNNLEYLKLCIKSIKKHSKFAHDIKLHINEGSDGTLDYAKNNNFFFTFSKDNIGLCSAINKVTSTVNTKYVLYAHDDMYFCPGWDVSLINEIKKINHDNFFLSGTLIESNTGHIKFDCGDKISNFDEDKLLNNYKSKNFYDYQGSHYAPHLVSKKVWEKVGGFSEEFNPGDGSDPDFCMKLWNKNVRVFKTISKFKVYHFSSVTTRKGMIKLNNGTKRFTLKYGFNPRYFRKYYLKGDGSNAYNGPLNNPNMNFEMFIDYLINKIKFIYYKI